jgi:hypothetical protein
MGVSMSVTHPDPAWIPNQLDSWILIRISNPDPYIDLGSSKFPLKKELRISCDVFVEGIQTLHEAWTSHIS